MAASIRSAVSASPSAPATLSQLARSRRTRRKSIEIVSAIDKLVEVRYLRPERLIPGLVLVEDTPAPALRAEECLFLADSDGHPAAGVSSGGVQSPEPMLRAPVPVADDDVQQPGGEIPLDGDASRGISADPIEQLVGRQYSGETMEGLSVDVRGALEPHGPAPQRIQQVGRVGIGAEDDELRLDRVESDLLIQRRGDQGCGRMDRDDEVSEKTINGRSEQLPRQRDADRISVRAGGIGTRNRRDSWP